MVQVVKDLNSYIILSYYTVTITRQPADVTVLSGGTAMFICVVKIGRPTMGDVTTDDVKWNDNMGNAITRTSTDPYMVDNDFENVGQDLQLTSTLTITNVNTQQAGLYQFVLSLKDDDMTSREASLSVPAGNCNFTFACGNVHRWSMCLPSVLTLRNNHFVIDMIFVE